MNQSYPIFTEKNECHDCYKCIRHCPSKAIKIKDGSASVISELCVACGVCVKICPAGAKQIRNDVSRVKFILKNDEKVIAALAPSWRSAFKGIDEKNIINALQALGFHAVSEVALGAQAISSATTAYLENSPAGVYISSACPASVDYIKKYIPQCTSNIMDFISPALAHAKLLQQHFGEDARIVFIGPCAAKKQESDTHKDLMPLAITFNNLINWFEKEKIVPAMMNKPAAFAPEHAAQGKLYALEGGMLDTIRNKTVSKNIHYMALAGLQNIERTLADINEFTPDKTVFIECLACEGGCINGPGMPANCGKISDILTIADSFDGKEAPENQLEINVEENIYPEYLQKSNITDRQIKNELAKIGKHSISDELNCGGCGYQTCQDFAKAVIGGKAEHSMCLSYLRKLAQKKSNALIKYIPAGVVIADKNLNIIECNQHFSGLFDESTRLAYEVRPGMQGADLNKIIDFGDLFETALATGKEIIRNNYPHEDKIFNISVFMVEPTQIVGAVIQDVTITELHREQISNKAKAIIRKNVITVQKIANYLGEHMAETESLLREVATGYDASETPPDEEFPYEK